MTCRPFPILVVGALVALLSACPRPGPDGPGPGPQAATGARRPGARGPALVARPGGNYVAPLLSAERTVRIGALYYRKGGGGGVTPVIIRVGPNPDKIPEVGVHEQFLGGTGGQMRSSVWVAAFMAATTLGRELVDYRFSASTRGFVDGPSAGALFTAAMMAGLTGAPIAPRTTMTGTVNPDGSVGPVGGIPDKFRGAIKLGYKVLGYPVGQRVQKDHQGNLVDLQELATQGGARAYPIATIYDAYRLITRRTVPTRFVVQPAEMALPKGAAVYLTRKAREWKQIQKRFQTLLVRRRVANKEAVRRFQVSRAYLHAALREAKAGHPAAGYEFAARGASFAFTTFHYQDFLLHLRAARVSRDSRPLKVKAAKMFQGTKKSLVMFGRIRRLPRPTSVDQAIAQVMAYSLALENKAYVGGAVALYKYAALIKRRHGGRLSNKETNALERCVTYMGVAQSKAIKARHLVGLAARAGRGFSLSNQRLKTIANQLSSMAQANLAYADAVIVSSLVKATHRPKAFWQVMLTNYLVSSRNARASLLMDRVLNKGTWQWSLAELGAALSSYLHSSMLLTKLYSLGAFHRMGGEIKRVRHQRALMAMLRHGEMTARQAAARARRAIGYVPLMSRYYYEVGAAMRRSGQTMQVKALEMFWRSSLLSQLAVMLARPG